MKIEELVASVADNSVEAAAEFTDDTFDRAYIGGSSIGHACERSIALRLRAFPKDKRTPSSQRILGTGHLFEQELVKILRRTIASKGGKDFKLTHVGKSIKDQLEVTHGNFVRAYGDGVIERKSTGERGLVEFKTANDSSFNSTVRLGVRYAHPEYYDQMQLIMGKAKMGRCLFIMINKNNSKLHAETVYYDDVIYHYLLARAEYIGHGHDEKVANHPGDFRCALCDYKQACWFDAPIQVEERVCGHCKYSVFEVGCDDYVICRKGVDGIPATSTLEVKRELASTCPHFEDYRS